MTLQRSPRLYIMSYWQSHKGCISLCFTPLLLIHWLGSWSNCTYNTPLLLNGVAASTSSGHPLPSIHHHCEYPYPPQVNSSVCSEHKITRLLSLREPFVVRKSVAWLPSRKVCCKLIIQSLRKCLITMNKFPYLWCTFKSFLMRSTTIVESERHNTCLNPVSQQNFKPWY